MSDKKREQSAIDAIYDMLEEMRDIKKQIIVMDNNIKLLNNKISKIPGKAQASTPKAIAPTKPAAQQVSGSPVKMVKLFGRIKNQRKKPIKNVYVKVYTAKGEIIKSRETDSDGYWEARVPVGSYSVELNASHINPKFRPINKNVILEETMNEVEVK